MFSPKRLFGFLSNGEAPAVTALDAAIEAYSSANKVDDEVLEEMIAFLRGTDTPKGKARRRAVDVNDEEPKSLVEHDKQYHPEGYSEGDAYKFRESMAKGDSADVMSQASKENGKPSSPASTLSNKKRKEYVDLMRRKHPDIDVDKVLSELGKIADKKIQGDAFKWVMKGGARLPEGLYKIEQAREMADKAKVDPLQYNTPQACIDELSGSVKLKEKPIDPDSVPELSDKRVLPMGVTTYLVQDDKDGQKAMRKIIDTHWGKDANPWCLLAREERGMEGPYWSFEEWWEDLSIDERHEYREKIESYYENLSSDDKMNLEADADEINNEYEDNSGSCTAYELAAQRWWRENIESPDELNKAWEYWLQYSALPKRVAFKDGKLLAFMATEALDEDEFDMDYKHSEIFDYLAKHHQDILDEYQAEPENEDDGISLWLLNNKKGVYREVYEALQTPHEQWWDRQDMSHKGIPIGNMPVKGDKFGRWADYEIVEGSAEKVGEFHKGKEGKPGYVEWHDNGVVHTEVDKNGHSRMYHEDGSLKKIWDAELQGSIYFHSNGSVSEIEDNRMEDGSASMLLSEDGKIIQWSDSNGYGLPYWGKKELRKADQSQKQAMLDYIPKAKELFKKYSKKAV